MNKPHKQTVQVVNQIVYELRDELRTEAQAHRENLSRCADILDRVVYLLAQVIDGVESDRVELREAAAESSALQRELGGP